MNSEIQKHYQNILDKYLKSAKANRFSYTRRFSFKHSLGMPTNETSFIKYFRIFKRFEIFEKSFEI